MSARVIQWPAEAIWEQVAAVLPNFTVEILPEIDSTNTELMRRAKAGQLEPILLVAERQTAGRGRLGREWHNLSEHALSEDSKSPPALTFSLGMPLSPQDWSGLSLAVGVSIAQSLHPAIGLKWPNDLWLKERKLAGILIETTAFNHQRYAVIGVGINMCEPSASSAPRLSHLRTPAAWLQELLPMATAPDTLQRVALPLIQTVLAFETHGFAPFQTRFNALDVLRGRQVVVHANLDSGDARNSSGGIAQGVANNGALLLNTEQGMQSISSSEVSVRPF